MIVGTEISRSSREAVMVNDLVKCPLCGDLTHIDNPELLTALHDSRIRQQIESYVAELLRSRSGEFASVGQAQQQRDFNKEVHHWNPNVPMWRRSAKE